MNKEKLSNKFKIDSIHIFRKNYSITENLQIWSKNLNSVIDQKKLLHRINEFRDLYPSSNNERVINNLNKYNPDPLKCWNSSYYTHLVTNVFCDIVDIFENECNTFLQNSKLNRHQSKLKVIEFWIAIYQNGEYALLHDHKGFDYSCVYYPIVNDNMSPLNFEDGFKFNPIDGSFAMFPGNYSHSVDSYKGVKERIVIAANLEFVHNQFL